MNIFDELYNYGIVPVVKIDNAENAIPLAKALSEGGLPCAEITFRTFEGKEAIKRISNEMPEILIGAGTVLTTSQVDDAISAGAKFIVSPGFNPNVVSYCIKIGIPIIPGCSTPSDMERAIEMGVSNVKFFPAELSGGLKYLKAVSAPYTNLRFMPTGGISEQNMNDYLSFNKIIACGGSWMVNEDLINDNQFDEIKALTKNAVKLMLGFTLAHIGINTENEQEALKAAKQFELLFGFECKIGNNYIFAGSEIEFMKSPYLGKNGHIAIGTNNVSRATAYLERNGFSLNMETAKLNENGKLLNVYLKEEVAGFAIHLLQK